MRWLLARGPYFGFLSLRLQLLATVLLPAAACITDPTLMVSGASSLASCVGTACGGACPVQCQACHSPTGILQCLPGGWSASGATCSPGLCPQLLSCWPIFGCHGMLLRSLLGRSVGGDCQLRGHECLCWLACGGHLPCNLPVPSLSCSAGGPIIVRLLIWRAFF